MSDLHLEFGYMDFPNPDCDIILLAGDIDLGTQGLTYANEFSLKTKKPVLMTTGNHEYYNQLSIQYVEDQLQKQSSQLKSQARYLQRQVYYNNKLKIRVLACTLWTDFNLDRNRDYAFRSAKNYMNDYHVINNFTPTDAFNWCYDDIMWLIKEISRPCRYKTIVMTHHAPSSLSIAEKYKNMDTNPCYASNFEYLMNNKRFQSTPILWVHGHTHESFDYTIYNTRVICNPRGYTPNDLNPNFNPELVITI